MTIQSNHLSFFNSPTAPFAGIVKIGISGGVDHFLKSAHADNILGTTDSTATMVQGLRSDPLVSGVQFDFATFASRIANGVIAAIGIVGFLAACREVRERYQTLKATERKLTQYQRVQKAADQILQRGKNLLLVPAQKLRLKQDGIFLKTTVEEKMRTLPHQILLNKIKLYLESVAAGDLLLQGVSGGVSLANSFLPAIAGLGIAAVILGVLSSGIATLISSATITLLFYRLHKNSCRRSELQKQFKRLEQIGNAPEMQEMVLLEKQRLTLETKKSDKIRASIIQHIVCTFLFCCLSIAALSLNFATGGLFYLVVGGGCLSLLAITGILLGIKKYYFDKKYIKIVDREKEQARALLPQQPPFALLTQLKQEQWIDYLTTDRLLMPFRDDFSNTEGFNFSLLAHQRLRDAVGA